MAGGVFKELNRRALIGRMAEDEFPSSQLFLVTSHHHRAASLKYLSGRLRRSHIDPWTLNVLGKGGI